MAKKILICCNIYPPNFIGGAELIAHFQAKALQQCGHNVIVFAGDTVRNGERHSLRRDTYERIPVHRVHLEPRDFQPEFVNFFHAKVESRFNALVEEFSPDVVHMHNIIGLSAGIIHAAKRRGIKTVMTLHDHWGFCYKNTLIKHGNQICQDYSGCAECMPVIPDEGGRNIPMRLRRDFLALQLQDVDAFVTPSMFIAETYVRAGIPVRKIRVIWNGVDIRRFSRVTKTDRRGKVRFTFIGYFGSHKGIDTIADALERLGKPDSVVVNLVGDGQMLERIRARIQETGFGSSVKFWGKIENSRIEEVFRETDVQLLPSVWPENQPVSITEAMATRTPVIAARIGGIPELVGDGVNGYLFEPGDAADLAAKMAIFVAHPERISALGDAGFRKIRDNSFDSSVHKLLSVYDEPLLVSSSPGNEILIACAGRHFDDTAIDAIESFGRSQRLRSCRFVLNEWLTEDQFRHVKLFWLVDRNTKADVVAPALRNGIPLLVPEAHAGLRDLCRSHNCGLYYQNSAEAAECLSYLIANEGISAAMGSNGSACHGLKAR